MSWTIEGSMKCVCGYEYEAVIDDDHFNTAVTKGDDPFIKIEGSFHQTIEGYYTRIQQVKVYGCPKCGTLKMGL